MCLDGTTVGSPPAPLMANPGCMGLPTVPMDAANATAVAGYMTAGLRRVPKYPPRRPLTRAIRARCQARKAACGFRGSPSTMLAYSEMTAIPRLLYRRSYICDLGLLAAVLPCLDLHAPPRLGLVGIEPPSSGRPPTRGQR